MHGDRPSETLGHAADRLSAGVTEISAAISCRGLAGVAAWLLVLTG
jgi:hypothetical protein